jgi:rubrerythrin
MGSVWEAAKEIEQKGYDYYEKLAAETSFDDLKGVFSKLSEEEQRHYNLFTSMENGMPPEESAGPNVMTAAKDAFQRMAKAFKTPDDIGDTEQAYAHALEFEQASIDYYQEILSKTDDKLQAAAIGSILAEEKRHKRLIQGLVEFVRRPKEWLEDAEFYHLEEY